jgi:peptidoglycan/LPS O-acetylase OafA/YrhL
MRIKHIDALRGLAALLVTIFHITGSSGLTKQTASYFSFGWVGVDIFFVISGFILPYSMMKTHYKIKAFGIFILKRVIRVYPAYIISIGIGVVMAIITGRYLYPKESIILHILLLNNLFPYPSVSPVFWTLTIEFQFYLLVGLLFYYFSKSNISSLILITALVACSLYVNNASYILRWFPFFALGILIFNKRMTNMPPILFWIFSAAIWFVIAKVHGLPQLIASIFALLFILYAKAEKQTLFNRIILWLGTISYSLYLVHWEIGRAAVNVSRRILFIHNIEIVKVLIGIGFSILSAWLLYMYIEKPSIRYSKHIKYKS